MNTKVLLVASLIAVFTMGFYADNTVAFAQYMGNVGSEGQTGTFTLEDYSDPKLNLRLTLNL